MKKILLCSIASFLALLFFAQCKPDSNKTEVAKTAESVVQDINSHDITVKEVLQANAYTYLLVNEAKKDYWIAVPKTEVTVGKNYSFQGGMEMKKFESKDLKRTFDSVLFVEGLIDPNPPVVSEATAATAKVVSSKELISGITLTKGAISIYDLYANRTSLAGKTVILTGKVVKFMPDIMKKNWIHLQDGSNFNGFNDITITTSEKVQVDQIVSLKGTVVLDKDLGSGYKYDMLIEDARVVK